MKVLHLSTYDNSGGAALAAKNIHNACLKLKIDSKMLNLYKFSDESNIFEITSSFSKKINYRAEQLNKNFFFSFALKTWSNNHFNTYDISNNKLVKEADIIILYWVGDNFLSIDNIHKILNSGKKIFWRFSDIWPITAGCHYSYNCEKYQSKCINCFQFKGIASNFILNYNFNKKLIWPSKNLTIVCPSKWILDKVSNSKILFNSKKKIIKTGVDTSVFSIKNKFEVKKKLKIPLNQFIILFGSQNPFSDPRKGFEYFDRAINLFKDKHDSSSFLVLVFGENSQDIKLNYPYISYGFMSKKEELSDLYSASDVFVSTSIEDNLPNTILEAMSSNLPTISFDTGGCKEIIDDNLNGYLIKKKDTNSLFKKIELIYQNKNIFKDQPRKKILAEYDILKNTKKFINLLPKK